MAVCACAGTAASASAAATAAPPSHLILFICCPCPTIPVAATHKRPADRRQEGSGRFYTSLLRGNEARERAAQGRKLLVAALLDDAAMLEDHDQVGVADGRQAMGDHEGGA